VWLELSGGRQPGLELPPPANDTDAANVTRQPRPPRPHAPTVGELMAHRTFLSQITKPIWLAR
jgi:DNA polymerase-3 subunit epsilon